jgi:hypothetical protein
MAEHVWSVLCRKAVIDRDGGQISLHEVIETIVLEPETKESQEELEELRGPIRLPQDMYIVSWWVRSDYDVPEEVKLRLVIEKPDGSKGIMLGQYVRPGQPLAEGEIAEMPLDLRNSKSFRRLIRVRAFPWAGVGVYHFIIEGRVADGDWRLAARIPLNVGIHGVGEPSVGTE